ncbi:Rieske (2Fe-2S) protein [Nocardioides sp.]|uniref:Rieske (2Fe-2S) protein n=1 Tax=Nocardioides sp. TaxID=35761 RepID=UPI00286A94C9|nr:Rieske (2Fe-2S) protein [Nocardioides sp.]
MSASGLSRRRALSSAAGVGLGLPVLAACGGDGTTTSASDPSPTPAGPSPSASPSASATPEVPTGGFALTADIPVGGGGVFEEQQVVVTQPTEGEFKGFSFVCTHSGCPVNQVTDEILCPCHGSKFSITDGSPTAGPASSPLAAVELVVDGDSISLA